MPNDTDKILKAVGDLGAAQVEATTQITKRLDTFDGRLVEQGKDIAAVRGAHEKHRAWHDGQEKAKEEAAAKEGRTTARWSAIAGWAGVVVAVLVAIGGAGAALASYLME